MLYTVVLVAVSIAPWILGHSGPVYGYSSIVLGLGFIVASARLLLDKQDATGRSLTKDKPARQAFKYSLIYLFALFLMLAIDHLIW